MASVLALAVLTMPSQLYPGDNHTIRIAAANFYLTGDLGIDYSLKEKLDPYLSRKGQFFIENDSRKKFYSRYGEMNTLLFAIPELIRQPSDVGMSGDMVFYGNIQNLAFIILTTIYLFSLLRIFGGSSAGASVIVWCALYGTFVWPYLRAQTYEIIHLAFFLGVFYHFARFVQTGKGAQLIASQIFLAMLVLSKNSFFLLYPALLVALWVAGYQWRRWSAVVIGCGSVALAAYFAVIYFKTGVLQITAEGAPNVDDLPRIGVFSMRYFFPNLREYSIGANGSLFLLFPPLLLALPFWPQFWRQRRSEATFLLMSFALTAVMQLFFNSRGELCYGPRYFVFILPAMSLPLLYAFRGGSARPLVSLVRLSLIVCSVLLFYMHYNFCSRPFFMNYQFGGWADRAENGAAAKEYCSGRNESLMARDFNSFVSARSDHFPPIDAYIGLHASPEVLRETRHKLAEDFPCNFYFKVMCP